MVVVLVVIIPFLCGENCGDNCNDSFMSNGGMSALLLWSELLVCARYFRTWALILGSVCGLKIIEKLHIRTNLH